MLKKKTERLIPQSDQPEKQVSRGKVTVPKTRNKTLSLPKKTVLRTAKQQKNQLPARKIPPGRKTKSAKNKKPKFKNTAKIRAEKAYLKACEKRTQDNQSSRQLKGSE